MKLDQTPPISAELSPLLEMSGDQIIPSPDVAYDTTVELAVSPEQAWAGRFGVTRMGEVESGYAGLLLPPMFDPILREDLRSLPVGADEPKQLVVGDVITDGKGDVKVVEIDDETKTILFESVYAPEGVDEKPMHYTWQIRISKGEGSNAAVMLSRTRMENLKNPRFGKFIWPRVDKAANRILAKGIERDDSETSKKPIKTRVGTLAIAAAGKARSYKQTRLVQR